MRSMRIFGGSKQGGDQGGDQKWRFSLFLNTKMGKYKKIDCVFQKCAMDLKFCQKERLYSYFDNLFKFFNFGHFGHVTSNLVFSPIR